MTKEDVISQIESIRDNSQSFVVGEDHEKIWDDDIEACNIVLMILRTMQLPIRLSDTCMGFLENGSISFIECANKREGDKYFRELQKEVKHGITS